MKTILPENKNPALRQKAEEIPIAEIRSKHIQSLIKEMRALLAKEEFGVALARDSRNAPDETHEATPRGSEPPPLPDQVYINPVLTKVSREKKQKHEGCLSIRGKWGAVPRAEKATVRAHDEHGKAFTRGASGFLAHVFQHELDHLEGVLYTDKATKLYDEKESSK